MNNNAAARVLQHAAWHCMFGSLNSNEDREPEQADIDAATILNAIRRKYFKEVEV